MKGFPTGLLNIAEGEFTIVARWIQRTVDKCENINYAVLTEGFSPGRFCPRGDFVVDSMHQATDQTGIIQR